MLFRSSKLIDFEKLYNARDLGGMKTADGRQIKKGKLIRSEQLAGISSADKAKLEKLLDTVVDFRNTEESQDQPDCDLSGVRHIANPILPSAIAGVSHEEESDEQAVKDLVFKPKEASEYMRSMYRKFLSDYCVSSYSRFIKILLEDHEKAVLWHCSAGKDRAGVGAVVIEEILGIPRETIIADYLKTMEYLSGYVSYFRNYIIADIEKSRPLSDQEKEVVSEAIGNLFGLDRSYLEAYFEAVNGKYGDFGTFIREGLGLSDEQIEKLRSDYLE